MFQVVGAMAVEDGVVTAVIPQADKLTLPAIAKLRHELTAKARAGRLMLPVELG
jgi:pyruvate/2-oxoglutarate dehydrogenase complex dihydrolipoamide acyltransferase (E2) component